MVEDGCITEVYKSASEITMARSNAKAEFDLKGQWVMPAFEDAHNHPGSHSRISLELDFRDQQLSWKEAAVQISERAAKTPPGEWVAIHGWNETTWPTLTQSHLDALSKEHGIIIANLSYHAGLVNQFGMSLLSAQGLDIKESSEMLGRLEEIDFERAFDSSAPNVEAYSQAMLQFYQSMIQRGIVGVQDLEVRSFRQLETYWVLDSRGEIPIPTSIFITPELFTPAEKIKEIISRQWNTVDIRGVKLVLDGAFGTMTAAVSEPYADDPSVGILRMSLDEIESAVAQAVELGLTEVAMHCIGDVACDLAAEAIATLTPRFPSIRQWRCEHFELPTLLAIQKIAGADGSVCMQPNFTWDAHNYAHRLGDDRLMRINPFRQILDAGVPLVFGSDDMPTGPLEGIHWAVFKGMSNEQKLSLSEAWTAYSRAGAQLAGYEDRGILSKGMQANMITLADDPFSLSSDDFAKLEVRETWSGGECVYSI